MTTHLLALLFAVGITAGTSYLILCIAANRLLRKLDAVTGKTAQKWASVLRPFRRLEEAFQSRSSHYRVLLGEAGAELQQIVDRHELLTTNLAAAVVMRDAQNQVTYCSPFTEVLTGYSLQEIHDTPTDFFLSIVHEEDRSVITRALQVSAVGEPFQYRYRFYHKTGMLMWAETRTVPILSFEGVLTSSLSITIDVTSSVLYQKQVEEKNRDLQDFTYMVSHDLKAPIATIRGMLAIIEEDSSEEVRRVLGEPLSHLTRAVQRLEQLVSSVLEYSRVSNQELSTRAVPLTQIVQEVTQDLQFQLDRHGAALSVSASLPAVLGDELRLYQVFSNLLGNAIKYRHSTRPLKVQIVAAEERNPRYTTILVRDNGMGISSDNVESIFRPFYRVAGHHTEGAGIGLACVKKIIERSGGTVTVTRSGPEGTEFAVTLRRAPERPTPLQETELR